MGNSGPTRFPKDIYAIFCEFMRSWVVGLSSMCVPSWGLAQAPQIPLRERVVPLTEARVTAPRLRPRRLGNASDSDRRYYWLDNNVAGNQVGQHLALARPGWLTGISFHVAACSYDSLLLGVQVYTLVAGFPAQPLLPQPVGVRLGRAQLRQRVRLDLRPQQLWLPGDVVVALVLLQTQGPGTLAFSADAVPGPLYFLDLPGDGSAPNYPPRGTHPATQPRQVQGAGGSWQKFPGYSVGIEATVAQ